MRTLFAATFAAAFFLSSLAITAATPARPAKRGRWSRAVAGLPRV